MSASGAVKIVGADDTDHRLLHLLLCEPECIKQTSVGRLLGTRFHIVTSHYFSPPLSLK